MDVEKKSACVLAAILAAPAATQEPCAAANGWVLDKKVEIVKALSGNGTFEPCLLGQTWTTGSFFVFDNSCFAARVTGSTHAYDGCPFEEANVRRQGWAVSVQSYTYAGEGVGEVELYAVAEVSGKAELIGADASARASGYGEFVVTVDGEEKLARTELVAAQAATQVKEVAGLDVGVQGSGFGGGVTIPLVVSNGLGVFEDAPPPAVVVVQQCPVVNVTVVRTLEGFVECWAEGTWTSDGESRAWMEGEATITLGLLEHESECP